MESIIKMLDTSLEYVSHELIDKTLYIIVALTKKDLSKFDKWIDDVSKLKIKELDGYIKGVKSDYNSIINAIILDYNNGLAEDKLKTIKRIMPGRNNFDLLLSKIIYLESLKKINRIWNKLY